jgi:hypothetical protein
MAVDNMQRYRAEALFRAVPTARVAQFIRTYMAENYTDQRPVSDFAFDSGLHARYVKRILDEEFPNVTFNVVDSLFTRLECDAWYVPAEQGGFADYYSPDIPPAPAQPNLRQRRIAYTDVVRRAANKKGRKPVDEAHERALLEDMERAA